MSANKNPKLALVQRTLSQNLEARDRAFRDLEPDVCDLVRKILLTELAYETEVMDGIKLDDSGRVTTFAVYNLVKRAKEFKKKYYDCWDAE